MSRQIAVATLVAVGEVLQIRRAEIKVVEVVNGVGTESRKLFAAIAPWEGQFAS
jgi:hypothetical protein